MSATKLTKVLVVDDDPVIAKSFDRVLSRQGYAVVTAADGEEALRKIETEQYDAVFTDIRMPGVDGITVAERIKAEQPWMPVVIVSGYATAESEARAKAAGVYAVLHKPLTPQMIEQSARDALASPHQAHEAHVEAPVAAPAPMVAAPVAAPVATKAVVEQKSPSALRMIAAPFVTLAFVVAGPFLGLAAIVLTPLWHFAKWLAARPTTQFRSWVRDIALFVAAPFLSLAYIIALPFVGFGMVAWVGIKALFGHHGKAAEAHGEVK